MRTRKNSRVDTSLYPANRVIQLSTAGRTRYDTPDHRITRRNVRTVSAVARTQILMARSFSAVLIILMILFFPIGAFAQEAPVSDSSSSAPTATGEAQPTVQQPTQLETAPPPDGSSPAPTTQKTPPTAAPQQPAPEPSQPAAPDSAVKLEEPQKPDGTDANKYTYNKSTGMWENGEYAWNPSTGQTKPLSSPDYSYNPETKAWDTPDWRFDGAQGKYVPNAVSLSPGSSGSEIKLDDGGTGFFALYNNASISNTLNSTARTGNVWVSGNTIAGSALSGNALTVANIFNMLNSAAGLQGGGSIATFSSDIYGDVVGDLYIDPAVLAALQPASGGSAGSTSVKLSVDQNQKIENNVDLSALSGNASVTRNTSAGGATSGSADAVANLVNMLNSTISSGSTFLGLLNIYGNLNGDILLPPGVLNSLIASNAGSSVAAGSQTTSANVDLNDSQSIANNIFANAESGNAVVAKNTSAGSATTGTARTNVTVLNLTGRDVVAANSLLVFVNVLGHWVGLIVNAPPGSTSAALGTSVTENSARSADIASNTDSTVVNNVNLNARSGDANVTGNTLAGSAVSGNATASANIANIINSSFSLSNWFGILFINVFGSWNGSFGINTAAGNKPRTTGGQFVGNTAPRVFRFVPSGDNGTKVLTSVNMNNPSSARAVARAVKSAQDEFMTRNLKDFKSDGLKSADIANPDPTTASGNNKSTDYTLPVLGFAVGGSLLGGERLVSRRQRRRHSKSPLPR